MALNILANIYKGVEKNKISSQGRTKGLSKGGLYTKGGVYKPALVV